MKKIIILTFMGFLTSVLMPNQTLAGEVAGAFHLEQRNYCVGEPILVLFSVTNSTQTHYSFSVGGDYRGTLRHNRFSFKVEDKTGKSFNEMSLGNMGGLGTAITLKPGEIYLSYQLLNSWVHLLPPGQYTVVCETALSLDLYENPESLNATKPITIKGELNFCVVQYDRGMIMESLRRMEEPERIENKQVKRFWTDKPVLWVLSDLSRKFQMGLPEFAASNDFRAAVLSRLPAQWDDRYYLDYDLHANRNWLTEADPEEFKLTFSVRNNSNKELPHNLTRSSVFVDGNALPEWPRLLKDMMEKAKLSDMVGPGQMVEISTLFNKYLTTTAEQEVLWKNGTVSDSVPVLQRNRNENSKQAEQSNIPTASIEIREATISDAEAKLVGVVSFTGLDNLTLDNQVEYTKFFSNRADLEFSDLKWGGRTIQGFAGKIEFSENRKADAEHDQFVVFLITLKTKDPKPETIKLWAIQQINWKSQPVR